MSQIVSVRKIKILSFKSVLYHFFAWSIKLFLLKNKLNEKLEFFLNFASFTSFSFNSFSLYGKILTSFNCQISLPINCPTFNLFVIITRHISKHSYKNIQNFYKYHLFLVYYNLPETSWIAPIKPEKWIFSVSGSIIFLS